VGRGVAKSVLVVAMPSTSMQQSVADQSILHAEQAFSHPLAATGVDAQRRPR
jgi:hypothetical protein